MTEWTQCEGDEQRSGVRRAVSDPVRVEAGWTADLVGTVGPPVLDRDTVFVGTDRGNCYAFDRETGRRRWVVETMTATDTAPVRTRDRLFFGTTDGTIHAVDPATGEQYWQLELPTSLTTPLLYADGDLYAGHEDGLTAIATAAGDEVEAFDLDGDNGEAVEEPGTVRWTVETDTPVTGAPVIARPPETGRERAPLQEQTARPSFDAELEPESDQNLGQELDGSMELNDSIDIDTESDEPWDSPRIYAATADEHVHCLASDDGEGIWTAPTNDVATNALTVADGRVYVADAGGTLLALNAGTGQTWFTYTITGGFTSSATVLTDEGTTLVGANDGYAHVTDTTFGRRKLRGWLFSKKGVALDGEVQASPVVAGDVLCVGDTTGSLYGLDLTDDCDHLWHHGFEDPITATPAVGDGELFVGTGDRLVQLEWSDELSLP
ncbi:PQQ repeat protein [Natrialba magadii ATCC 43099]|uniref:PQQ repeat protein n=1 Tax=Natrialba magadii (strain ATCC 43099 / DSM 3394 / CCM 3739 / CIP 104546 / IAM 13178 / JCM 8861 / NBRC 102185 / NCIMB 2190 / MS3) TaxID=547559 RepID=D3SUZ5_NATMM|nr:PQQ-binding-like beta-propeller repeat protein [Natrialba magadii]ADD05403.1 PQQ repeat protein [Natrialba magadii ATCC 43099]ELY29283.1 pyrrolo-quinoline quinone [Natrialba magadii ATCC 43099]